MKHEGLLPLDTLCHAESGEKLLGEVAAQINQIKSRERRREALSWSRVLAGLRYDKGLIYQILTRTVQRQIERLVVEQLEALCEALLYFQTKDELTRWLKEHASAR